MNTNHDSGSRARYSGKVSEKRAAKPFLRSIQTSPEHVVEGRYPFTIPAFRDGIGLRIDSMITMLVGENGSGKSTLLEAVAAHCGFSAEGGTRNTRFQSAPEGDWPDLARALRLSWSPKINTGFFLRAESFFNFATYLDRLAEEDPRSLAYYGGKSLHAQSHGESFLALFQNAFENGIYLLDEPEAALSPQRQLAFLSILHDLERTGRSQFLIATHSPIILAYPGATLLSLDGSEIRRVEYKDTDHYRITHGFLNNPERYFAHLFEE